MNKKPSEEDIRIREIIDAIKSGENKDDENVITIGRPPKLLDEVLIYKLASLGSTLDEIGYAVGCSSDTLTRRYAAVIEAGKAAGRISIRRNLFAAAARGNTSVLIFLSKTILGMREAEPLNDALPEIVLGYNLLDGPPQSDRFPCDSPSEDCDREVDGDSYSS